MHLELQDYEDFEFILQNIVSLHQKSRALSSLNHLIKRDHFILTLRSTLHLSITSMIIKIVQLNNMCRFVFIILLMMARVVSCPSWDWVNISRCLRLICRFSATLLLYVFKSSDNFIWRYVRFNLLSSFLHLIILFHFLLISSIVLWRSEDTSLLNIIRIVFQSASELSFFSCMSKFSSGP